MTTVTKITVIGAGTMGNGIAQVSAMAGFETTLYDVQPAALEGAMVTVKRNLDKGIELGKVTISQRNETLSRLRTEPDLATAVRSTDFVIEAAPEKIDLKLQLFEALDQAAPAHAVLATNTSSLSITEISAATRRPAQCIGMHFFNPVHKMKLIEIVRALETDEPTLRTTETVSKQMGKQCVTIRESPGFITSRINAMIGNEAFAMLEEGIASARDIDTALKLGLNHPMGPFEMIDLVGLDTRLSILDYLHKSLGEKYRPSPLLVQYVKAGRLGKKVGKGVYEYPEPKK